MKQLSAMIFLLMFTGSVGFAQEGKPHPGPRSNDQGNFLFEEASTSQKEGKTDLAIADYQKLLKDYPRHPQRLEIYQQLMSLLLQQKKTSLVLTLGKEALLLHPGRDNYSSIQLLRADAFLLSGKTDEAGVVIKELLKTKPDSKTQTTALLYKAEILSLRGKNKEALAAIDAAKTDDGFSDTELKIRARACGAQKRAAKEELLTYFHEKNLCFKTTFALAKSTPEKESSRLWCERFKDFGAELKKAKTDSFTIEKIQKEMDETKSLAATWECG